MNQLELNSLKLFLKADTADVRAIVGGASIAKAMVGINIATEVIKLLGGVVSIDGLEESSDAIVAKFSIGKISAISWLGLGGLAGSQATIDGAIIRVVPGEETDGVESIKIMTHNGTTFEVDTIIPIDGNEKEALSREFLCLLETLGSDHGVKKIIKLIKQIKDLK